MTQIFNSGKTEPAALIERLIQLHKLVQQAYALRDEHHLEVGKILLSLRTVTPRGEWEPQLKELCNAIGMSRRTAHNYMNAAEKGAVTRMKDGQTLQAKSPAFSAFAASLYVVLYDCRSSPQV
jgi:hypothetical protein